MKTGDVRYEVSPLLQQRLFRNESFYVVSLLTVGTWEICFSHTELPSLFARQSFKALFGHNVPASKDMVISVLTTFESDLEKILYLGDLVSCHHSVGCNERNSSSIVDSIGVAFYHEPEIKGIILISAPCFHFYA